MVDYWMRGNEASVYVRNQRQETALKIAQFEGKIQLSRLIISVLIVAKGIDRRITVR